jgi:two-component system, LuxR family, response regulator FixJ
MSSLVYLLDDDEAVRESLAAILGLHDITVETFATAAAFLSAQFETHRSCLLIDIHLADGNGVETLSSLRRRGVTLPAILMSGRIEPRDRQEMENLGPVIFLEKPIDGDALAALLEEMLAAT